MFVINTTFCATDALMPEVVEWCLYSYIPKAEAAGFTALQLNRIINQDESIDSESVALQMQAESIEQIDAWLNDEGGKLLGFVMSQWQKKVLPFITLMEKLYDGRDTDRK